MKKALIVATVGGFIASFELNDIKILQGLGYEVHGASDFKEIPSDDQRKKLQNSGLICHQIEFARQPFNKKNFAAYKQLKTLMANEKFDIVHCHTPMGGVLGRLCARKYRKTGTKVFYTAHGFHFYNGAPKKNWIIYYPIEKICSYFTDTLITINHEDYALAKRKMKAHKVAYVPGVGIELEKFSGYRENHIREELEIPDDAKLLLSVGELNGNKNHEVVIRALAEIIAIKGDVYYVIAGQGDLRAYLQDVIDSTGLTGKVMLLGFRPDIADLYDAADIFVFPSRREGLSVALIEAMASGLPVVCSKIRGNVDLLAPEGGLFFEPLDVNDVKEKVEELLLHSKNELKSIGYNNLSKIRSFDMESVEKAIKVTYGSLSEIGGM